MQYKIILAQEDTALYRWQLKVFLSSVVKLGVSPEDIILLAAVNKQPHADFRKFEKYATCFYYEDTKNRFYRPSCKPYLFGRFWEEYPENKEQCFFFTEQDMLLTGLPDMHPAPGTWYWSDAGRYIESGKYEHVIGLKPNTATPGGFHAIGKGVDADFWYKVEEDSMKLFEHMCRYLDPREDRWICEMRSWIWNLWDKGFQTEISRELDFEYGKGPRRNVHLYHHLDDRLFNKRNYTDKEPFEDIDRYRVSPVVSASRYIEAIKDCRDNFLKDF
ncbi:hypothetical protein [Chitinophaga arvensicola]|uniref:Uncharacterized protein n=1 Tax=Chitinophaga arvensicola TaxID=29529 RepID=A0A1I0RB85_9BACT|nr:hypothetical protein [Chitinophaga arvensicola]SEW37524.1 hypothetical protein SAMN04488122_2516 [Chitinophaga arvensicola]